jgi:hypothetical protein
MALRHADSFGYYATADGAKKWNIFSGNVTVGAPYARTGSMGCRLALGGTIAKYFDSQATWVVGAAAYPTSAAALAISISLLDGGTAQLTLTTNASSGFTLYRGTASGTVLGSTSGPVLSNGVWAYIELKATINNTTGAYEVRVNGDSVLSASGVDTQNSANATADQVSFNSGLDTYIDDVYILDGTGSAPHNDFYGDVGVYPSLPSGAGATAQWDASAGSNYQCVDDATPNGDTDYVSTSTLNEIDTYAMGNITPTTGTVFGVIRYNYARKDEAGPRSIADVIRSGGVDYANATNHALSTSWQYFTDVYEQNPDTSAAWTISEVNAAEAGQKLTV